MGEVLGNAGGSAMLSFLIRNNGSSVLGGSVRKCVCQPILALYLVNSV